MRGAREVGKLRSLGAQFLQEGRCSITSPQFFEPRVGSSSAAGLSSLAGDGLGCTRCESLDTRVSQTCSASVRSHFGGTLSAIRPSPLRGDCERASNNTGMVRQNRSFLFRSSAFSFEASLRPARAAHGFSTSAAAKPVADAEKISVTFVNKDGEEKEIKVPVGMSMLEAAHENDVELEGACEGSLACSTCHVIITDEELYNKLPEPTDEENDMLDLAFGLTETSRLGCQVIAKPELDGLRLALPAATRNFAVDGHVPKPH